MAIADTQNSAAQRASGSSFYTAMRIMPRAQREAMFEIYSFCRKVDDIADDGGPRDQRLDQLRLWRSDIDALYKGSAVSRAKSLAAPVKAFKLRREDFQAVIDGMEMDVVADIRAPDWAKLDAYCDRVASAVGRLCVRVFGMEEKAGIALAYHLGRALQLTNILRDIDEDAAIGRLYLPREALQAANILTNDPAAVLAHPRLGEACAEVVARAQGHFAEADRIMNKCARKSVRAPRIMRVAYGAILKALVKRGWAAPRAPVKVSKPLLLLTILRYAFI
ncbi:MAG: presqualene diphosphate synthase [Hyphomicrobiales bacterium]|nr:presqualene diphosphate synthase [Hyphomicrobiales bacterium]